MASQSVWGKVPGGFGEDWLKHQEVCSFVGNIYIPDLIFAVLLPGIGSKAFSCTILKSWNGLG